MYIGLVTGICMGMASAAVLGTAYDSDPEHKLRSVLITAFFLLIAGSLPPGFGIGTQTDTAEYWVGWLSVASIGSAGMFWLSNYCRKKRQ